MSQLFKINTMKKSFIIISAVLSFVVAQAQQIPLYTQYYNNGFLFNPSQTLTEDYSSLNLFYRKQWVQSQSPLTTQGLVFQTPLKVEKIGLGVNLINDKFGIFNRTGVSMAYSYQVDLNYDHKLLLGLSAGYLGTNYEWTQDVNTILDPRIQQSINDGVNSFDATFGLTYKFKELEVGLAVPHLLEDDFDFTVNSNELLYFNYRHYLASAAYKLQFNKVSLRPLVLVRYQPAVNPQFDASLVFGYDEKVWAAASYRYEGAMTFGVGVNLHQRFNVGYSYDMNLNSDLAQYFGATHEINVGIILGKGKSATPPPPPPIIKDTLTTNTLSLEELQRQIDQLKKRTKEQSDSLKDHEARITDLELQMKEDSLQKTMENILDEMKVGSGSLDYRGEQLNLGEGSRPIVNPENPNALFGFKEDGTPISPNEKYDGDVFYDKNATRKVEDPNNPGSALYDMDGNRIEDLDSYNGAVKDKNGKIVKDKDGNVVYYGDEPSKGDNNSGRDTNGATTGSDDNTAGARSGSNTSTKSSAPPKSYSQSELIKDGIRYTAPGNYVVVGSFRGKANAIKLREQLQDQGYSAGIVYNHYRKWFYVYSIETDDFSEALSELRKERAGTHDDAWVHVIIE